jgi:hypothetical protein
VTVEYTGADGIWLVTKDANEMEVALLDEAFTAEDADDPRPGCWLILDQPNGIRVALKCKYVRVRRITATAAA